MGKILSNLFRIDTISSESATNSTDSELIYKICNVVYRKLTHQEGNIFVWYNYKSYDLSEEDTDELVRNFQDEYQRQYNDEEDFAY